MGSQKKQFSTHKKKKTRMSILKMIQHASSDVTSQEGGIMDIKADSVRTGGEKNQKQNKNLKNQKQNNNLITSAAKNQKQNKNLKNQKQNKNLLSKAAKNQNQNKNLKIQKQ